MQNKIYVYSKSIYLYEGPNGPVYEELPVLRFDSPENCESEFLGLHTFKGVINIDKI